MVDRCDAQQRPAIVQPESVADLQRVDIHDALAFRCRVSRLESKSRRDARARARFIRARVFANPIEGGERKHVDEFAGKFVNRP